MKSLHFLKSGSKKYIKKASLILLGLYIFPFVLSASISPPEWTLDAKINGVEFYHSIQDCNGTKVVFLKFNNTNTYNVKISWKEVFKTQAEVGLEGFSGKKELVIVAGITQPSGCADTVNKKGIVSPSDVSPTYMAEIQKFDYKEITVTKE